MQSRILKISTLLCALAVLISSCERKIDPKNQITIIINSVDGNTKENRVNMFDTIDVRIARWGFPMKRFVKVAEYITDSTGSVKVELDKSDENHFILNGKYINGIYITGSTYFSEGDLKDGEKVNLEVDSVDYR